MESALLTLTNSIVYVLAVVLLIAVIKTHKTWRITLARVVCIGTLYGLIQVLRILDESGYGLREIGSDFSSHTAGACALSLMIGCLVPGVRFALVLEGVNCLYWWLMMHHGFHNLNHIALTLLVFVPLFFGVCFLFNKWIPGVSRLKAGHNPR